MKTNNLAALLTSKEHGLRILVEFEQVDVCIFHGDSPTLHLAGSHLDDGVLDGGRLLGRDRLGEGLAHPEAAGAAASLAEPETSIEKEIFSRIWKENESLGSAKNTFKKVERLKCRTPEVKLRV